MPAAFEPVPAALDRVPAVFPIAGVVNVFAGRDLYWLIGFGGLASASTALRGLVTRYEVSAEAVRVRGLGGTRTIAASHIAHVVPTALIDTRDGAVRWPCTRIALRGTGA